MTRIAGTFAQLALAGRTALIPYITAGDPYADATADILCALADHGADILELGVPFSDPMADGPVIQRASERALARHVGLGDVLASVRDFRQRNSTTPMVLMGYANPFERYGLQRFVADAADAGVDGVLVVDYPPEECGEFAALLRTRSMDPIFLLAPTSSDERMRMVGELASGYVYYVSLTGVTGAGHLDAAAVGRMLPRIRAHVRVPVGVGFGIRDAAAARRVAEHADAVVIGSALVELLELQSRDAVAAAAGDFVAGIRKALDT